MTLTYRGPRKQWAGGTRTVTSTGATYDQNPAVLYSDCSEMSSIVTLGGPPYVKHNAWSASDQWFIAGYGSGTYQNGLQRLTGWRLAPGMAYVGGANPAATMPLKPSLPLDHYVNLALAREDKGSTGLNPYLFTWELRELPRLIRDAVRVLHGHVDVSSLVDYQLVWNYGLVPLYNDLRSLVDYGISFSRSLTRALVDKSEGGRLPGFEDFTTLTGASGVGSANHSLLLRGVTKVWYSMRYRNENGLFAPDLRRLEEFRDRLLNLNYGLETAWNALPWSFLVDYFVDLSKAIEACNGMIRSKPDSICIMAETRVVTLSYVPPNVPTFSVGVEPSLTVQHRQRFVKPHPYPKIVLNPLNMRELKMISLLGIASTIRRSQRT